jgi:hypothetical protein
MSSSMLSRISQTLGACLLVAGLTACANDKDKDGDGGGGKADQAEDALEIARGTIHVSLAEGEEQLFKINVPAAATLLGAKLLNEQGRGDLTVAMNRVPTDDDNDGNTLAGDPDVQLSFVGGVATTLKPFFGFAGGDWFVRVQASAGALEADLKVEYMIPFDFIPLRGILPEGVQVDHIGTFTAGVGPFVQQATFTVPAGSTGKLTISDTFGVMDWHLHKLPVIMPFFDCRQETPNFACGSERIDRTETLNLPPGAYLIDLITSCNGVFCNSFWGSSIVFDVD